MTSQELAAYRQQINQMKRGRTAEQKKVIDYFADLGGCLSSVMKDQDYDALVAAKVNGINFKERALNKIGLDESQVNEIEPIHFASWYHDDRKTFAKQGKDGLWRSSAYQVSWIFFSDTQVYLYQYTFHMDEDTKREATEEYFYKDITNFSSTTDTVEKMVSRSGCMSNTIIRSTVENDVFALIVPGDKLRCSMTRSDYTERAIQGMKAKLREKKL